ncbi:MAG TPA: hypothetical protein VG223_08845 [Solirubrobacteraceae bacterium]|nr:hypothetical protein [Solirubrobacteraceae bacterium]
MIAPADAGFEVAPGDPDQISQAAAAHAELANVLEYQYGEIKGAAGSVTSAWNGAAAQSYQSLSSYVADHYIRAGETANQVAQGLQTYAQILRQCQDDGKVAMRQTEQWIEEEAMWAKKLVEAQQAITAAQTTITDNSSALYDPHGAGAFSPSIDATAHAAVLTAQGQLQQAEADARTAAFQVDYCRKEVLRWQQRGRRAWEEAMQAAESATGVVDIHVTPPPLAGFIVPDRFIDPVAHHSFFSLHTLEDGATWVWDRVKGGFNGAVAAAEHPGSDSPLGVIFGAIAGATGATVGICVGASAAGENGFGVGGHVCFEGTPDGGDGIMVSGEAGASTPGAGVYVGGIVSNGQVPAAQGGPFTTAGVNGGEDTVVGADGAVGTYQHKTIWDGEGTIGLGEGTPVGGHIGESDTAVFAP